jgi:exosortase C (VPDSG-CTERM-specific)
MANQPQLDPVTGIDSASIDPKTPALLRASARNLLFATFVLILCFAKPLFDLLRFALKSDLFSHVLLIPFISGYLVWIQKSSLSTSGKPSRRPAFAFFAAGVLVLLGGWLRSRSGVVSPGHDNLTWMVLSLVLFFAGACFYCLPADLVRRLAFPLGFLVFMVPFPGVVVSWIEGLLQYASAMVADFFFSITGTSFFRDGLIFQLPGIRIQVAPECSGIHSSLVLFITSLLAGHLFLVSPWKRALLAFAVIPLGILRNAFRIWTIGQLCIHISPSMIHSPIHEHGGPLFFVLSLVPFTLLLLWLRRSERPHPSSP